MGMQDAPKKHGKFNQENRDFYHGPEWGTLFSEKPPYSYPIAIHGTGSK